MKSFFRQHIEKIISLTDEEFDYIYAHFTPKKLRKHQFLIEPGDTVVNDYFVLSGCLKAYQLDKNGKIHILQFAMQDWWVTDYQALYKGTKASIFLDCIEDSEVLCLSLQDREKLCSELHKIEFFFRKKSNGGYVALQQRILSLLTSSAAERYEQLLQLYPQLFQKVPKQLIAAYLGVSRETLSRLYSEK
jgi:CRP-like cAMP-binding protein